MTEPGQDRKTRTEAEVEDLYQRGWNAAAEMGSVERFQVYRQWYRERMDPFSVGFRDCTLRTMD
ncbi:hypothetical protein [Solicola gregarius]|uniref:Uncharacterized protein n=1 Tax=Solicola gregarius TaxID=2908642 RepID=A0AA46TMH4_9ACTN|nr:hypothetical protein [Solicola gregarius]UYM07654.1 hypothetical protein L0C25_11460 [Solicola gregarius]